VPNALSAFMDAWRGGEVNKRWMESSQFKGAFEGARLNKGAEGKILPQIGLSVGRFLEAQDKFFAAIIQTGEAARLVKDGMDPAKAQAEGEKLATDLLYRAKLGEEMSDVNKALLVRALDAAGHLLEMARNLPVIGKPISWFIPFVRTPIEAGKRMVEFSPLGYITSTKGHLSAEDLGRANAGSVITLAAGILALAGMTTGRPPRDPEERREWYNSGRKPWSILIGNRWVPMWYFGPFAGALAIPAAMRDTWVDDPSASGKNAAEKMASTVGAMTQFFSSQTPLSSAGQFLDIATGRTDATGADGAMFMAGQFIPASGFLRWANQLFIDPVYRRGGNLKDALFKDYPFLSKEARPHLDSEGNPVRRAPEDVLLPFTTGKTEPVSEDKWKQRNAVLKIKARNTAEVKKLSAAYRKGEIDANQVQLWIGQIQDKSERSRLSSRLKYDLKDRGLESPISSTSNPFKFKSNRR